jgi:uncharacterized membrane protein YeaQ/YmgE (transglycosylase-associated protein family)
MMDNLIVIFSGLAIAGIISKKNFSLFLDIIFGMLGAWASFLLVRNMHLPLVSKNQILTYLVAIFGSVSVIHLGRIFEHPSSKHEIFN